MHTRTLVTARFIAAVFLVITLPACKTTAPQKAASPQAFNEAIHGAANNLLQQVKQQEGITGLAVGIATGKTVFMLDPVVDANTAEVNQASLAVAKALREEAATVSDRYQFVPLSPENYDSAKYIVSGAILYANYTQASGEKTKLYKLALAALDRKTGKVIASTDAWIADKKIDVTPVASYQDSPMYLKDKRIEGQIETAQMAPGAQADPAYFDSLPTAALLSEADAAYESDKLERALGMYKAASLRPDGQIMKTYAGLYQTNRRLKKMDEAEVAFGQLVNIGYQNNNISTKLYFGVASTDFINDAELRGQYAIWLRQIAKLFARNSSCLVIAGHSSHSGSSGFNEQLSLQRALAVQRQMQRDFPQIMQRSKAVGMGWKENIIGSGTDDIQDAIDRRVEFKLTECGKS